MLQKLLIRIAFLLILFQANSWAQSIPYVFKTSDSNFIKKALHCGVTKSYIMAHAVDTSIHSGIGGPSSIVIPTTFPVTAIDTCGRFQIFYEDKSIGTLDGFDDPIYGANRRAVLCEVLSYVQNTFDFTSIPSGQFIRLQVGQSYTSGNPAPLGTNYSSIGSPYFRVGAGVTNGYVNDFVRTGIDPIVGHYHAQLQVNFDKTYSSSSSSGEVVDYFQNPSSTLISNCQIDLNSSLLHSITHCIGWFSFVVSSMPPVGSGGILTSIDTATSITPFATFSSSPFSSISKVITSGTITHTGIGDWWINSSLPPYNHPILVDGYHTLLHLQDDFGSYTRYQRISPGDWQEYVMTDLVINGRLRRVYTKGELESLKRIVGYNYNSYYASMYSSKIANHVPYSSKMFSDDYNHLYQIEPINGFHEKIKADYTITNDSGASLIIDLASDTSLHDADGHTISVALGTLVNIRGCGIGGNNHNALSLSAGNTKITYTPRHNFYGRAQFAFNLYDGIESGAYVVYTIDVKRGNNVSVSFGQNYVLNGDFEEGTEVKIKGTAEGIPNTVVDDNYNHESRFAGIHLGDSHPYDYYSCPFAEVGGGPKIKNSYSRCDSATTLKRTFGKYYSSFPYDFTGVDTFGFYHSVAPVSSIVANRYSHAPNGLPGYYYLGKDLEKCHRYVIEFDVYRTFYRTIYSYSLTDSIKTLIGFTSDRAINFDAFVFGSPTTWVTPRLYHSLNPMPQYQIDTFTWKHIRIPFDYCSDSSANILFFNPDYHGDVYGGLLFDNISIVDDTTYMEVTIRDSLFSACNTTRLSADTSHVIYYRCDKSASPLIYTWLRGLDTVGKSSVIYVANDTPALYKLIVSEGCHISSDTITISASRGPKVKANDTSICSGASIILHPIVTGTTGVVTYSWTPSTGLSCLTCANPIASPLTTTTYTLTVTDSLGCFTMPIKVEVNPMPVLTLTASPSIICGTDSSNLLVTGADSYIWTGVAISCTTCANPVVSPIVSSTYKVIGKSIYGCTAEDSIRIKIFPAITYSITSSKPNICLGDSTSLLITGGSRFTWAPPTGLSCVTCANPNASPTVKTDYTVFIIDSNGCTGKGYVSVNVLPNPMISVVPHDTSICGVGYVTLRASGASSYIWSPTSGLSSPTAAITPAYITATTKYYVTATDTNGCKGTDTVSVFVKSKPSVTVTSAYVNLCSGDSVILNASGATTYLWTSSATPSGIACSTCASTKGLPTSFPVTYTVTGTDTNGCSNTATVSASIVACACSPYSVFGTMATTLSTATLPTTLSSGYYYLPTDLTINANTVMTGAKILIERGVTITVANNAKLTLDSCHLFTCDEDTSKAMWRGIVLASGTTTSGRIEVRNNCLIEDALYAIDAIGLKTPAIGDVINVTNSTFNRNQVDISMDDYKVSSPSILPITIKGNLFTARKFSRTSMTGYPNIWFTTNTLKASTSVTDAKPAYYISKSSSLLKAKCKDASIFSFVGVRANNIGQTSSTGIYQSEIKIGEGAAADDYNLFDNHQYGFTSYNSNVSLYHNHFINISRRMTPDPSTTAPIGNGMAVILLSSATSDNRMQVLPSTSGNFSNKFHDCFMGIYSEDVATLNVQSTYITTSNTAGSVVAGAGYTSETYSGYGMMLHCDGIQKSNTVTGNNISNVNVGIQMSMVNPKSGVVNTFNNNFFNGINPLISSSYTGKQCMNKGMDIYSSGGLIGTANTMSISNNSLSKVFNGISMQGLTNVKCSTSNNTISIWDTITPVTTSIQYGIQSNNTNEATITSNAISNFNSAVLSTERIRGVLATSNTNLRICSNTTNNIGRGFEFAKGYAQTGTRWIANTINNGYKGMVLASDIGDQGFTYNWSSLPTTYWGATLNKWNITGSGKLQTYVDGTISSKLSKLYVRNITSGYVERPLSNFAFLSGNEYSYTGTILGSLQIPQSESNCMGAVYPIKTNPIPKPSLVGYKTLGSLIMADSLGYDASYNARQWMSQMSLYELGNIDPALRDSSSTLDSFMIAAAPSRFAWLTQIETAINNEDWSNAQNLLENPVAGMDRMVINDDIIITDYADADPIVANYVDYYTAYLHYLKGGMNHEDSMRVQIIANKCPVKDGVVVYKARTLYQLISLQNINYSDDSCEYAVAPFRKAQNNAIATDEVQYSLFPNPNAGVFTIKQSITDNKLCSVRLYNAVGVLLGQEKVQFSNGIANFKVQNPIVGLYMICLTDEQNKSICLKFNIQ